MKRLNGFCLQCSIFYQFFGQQQLTSHKVFHSSQHSSICCFFNKKIFGLFRHQLTPPACMDSDFIIFSKSRKKSLWMQYFTWMAPSTNDYCVLFDCHFNTQHYFTKNRWQSFYRNISHWTEYSRFKRKGSNIKMTLSFITFFILCDSETWYKPEQ